MAIEDFDQVTIEPAKLRPFSRFIMSIGELPTSYLDSLSYAEQITWFCDYLQNNVIPAVNNNAEALEEVQELITQLQEYVDNYFTDLDVQEEINNKLDQLVLNGTLENLIGAYIQPRIDAQNTIIADQNTRINNIDIKVSAATNGSPLVASSTTGMTDTDKIYVNTSDGYWYYYNGSAWTQGGIYQTSGIANGSVTYNNLEAELQNSFVEETTLINAQVVKGQCFGPDGTVSSILSTQYISIDVQPYESYKVVIPYLIATYGSNQPIYMFKNNDTVVSYVKGGDVTLVDNKFKDTIDIPLGVNKLLINMSDANNLNDTCSITKINKYTINNINKNQLDSKLQSIFTDNYTSVTPTLFVTNAYISPNRPEQLSGYKIYSVEVNPGEKYKITTKQIYNNPILTFGNANSTRTYTLNDNDYVFNSIFDKILGESGQQFTDYVFTIPANCNKIYINQEGNREILLYKSTSYKVSISDYDFSNLNPLNNKMILFVGDSICAASTAGVKGWATLISENNPTATVYNYGQDGATIADNGEDTNDVVTKIQTMYSDHPTADYIIIQGGVNDIWQSIPLGTFTENSNFNNSPEYDKTTFSGALEWIFYYCYTHFPGKKVGYIVTQKVYNSGEFWNYMTRAKEICHKWSIPYIDLYNEADLNYYLPEQRAAYSITTVLPAGDGCHPNLAGYQIITPKIENWLKYKI